MTTQTQLPIVPKKPLTIEQALRRAVLDSVVKSHEDVVTKAIRLLVDDGRLPLRESVTGRLRVLRWALFVETVQREGEAQS